MTNLYHPARKPAYYHKSKSIRLWYFLLSNKGFKYHKGKAIHFSEWVSFSLSTVNFVMHHLKPTLDKTIPLLIFKKLRGSQEKWQNKIKLVTLIIGKRNINVKNKWNLKQTTRWVLWINTRNVINQTLSCLHYFKGTISTCNIL